MILSFRKWSWQSAYLTLREWFVGNLGLLLVGIPLGGVVPLISKFIGGFSLAQVGTAHIIYLCSKYVLSKYYTARVEFVSARYAPKGSSLVWVMLVDGFLLSAFILPTYTASSLVAGVSILQVVPGCLAHLVMCFLTGTLTKYSVAWCRGRFLPTRAQK